MRRYYVLVHGKLKWLSASSNPEETSQPQEFYCYRYVLAVGERDATAKAFQRVEANLNRKTGWITAGLARLALKAAEVSKAPLHKLLKPDNRGHIFYDEDD